jgi:hypothetical protein
MCRVMEDRHSDKTSKELYETIRMDNKGVACVAPSFSFSYLNRSAGFMMHSSPLAKRACKPLDAAKTTAACDLEFGTGAKDCQWVDLVFLGCIDDGMNIRRNN